MILLKKIFTHTYCHPSIATLFLFIALKRKTGNPRDSWQEEEENK